MKSIKVTSKINGGALVVPIAKKDGRAICEIDFPMIDTKAINAALVKIGATAAVDEVLKFPISENLLIVATGLGKHSRSYSLENLRRAAGAAARSLVGEKSATFIFPTNSESELRAVAEGAALGSDRKSTRLNSSHT